MDGNRKIGIAAESDSINNVSKQVKERDKTQLKAHVDSESVGRLCQIYKQVRSYMTSTTFDLLFLYEDGCGGQHGQ